MQYSVFLRKIYEAILSQVRRIGGINIFLVSLLIIITIYPILFTGLTTSDGFSFTINAAKSYSGIWEYVKEMTIGQGRVGWFWTVPLLLVPYFIDSQLWYLFFKVVPIILLIWTLYFSISKLFKSKWVALMSIVLFISFVQNGWDHNALTAYPLVYNLYAVLLFISLSLFAVAIERKKINLAIFAGFLYFITLAVELFILFSPLFLIVFLSRIDKKYSLADTLKVYKKYILAISMPVFVYIIAYIIFQIIFNSAYDGNTFAKFDAFRIFKVVKEFSLSAFPYTSFEFILSPKSHLLYSYESGWRAIFSGVNLISFVKASLVGVLLYRIIQNTKSIVLNAKKLCIGISVTFVSIFIPNILLGFSVKYQNWVIEHNISSYLYTYYSLIAAVIFMSLVFAYVYNKSASWSKFWRKVLAIIFVSVIMFAAFAVNFRNQYIYFDQYLAQQKLDLLDIVFESTSFSKVADGATIITPALLDYRGIARIDAINLAIYVEQKTGKKVVFSEHYKCLDTVACYMLAFQQEDHADKQFAVFGRITNFEFVSGENLTVYVMPAVKGSLMGNFIGETSFPEIKVDSVSTESVKNNVFSAEIPSGTEGDEFHSINITSNTGVKMDSIVVSHYNSNLELIPLLEQLENGIDFTKENLPNFLQGRSGFSGYEPWGIWTDATISSKSILYFKKPLPKVFNLKINTIAFGPNVGADIKIKIGQDEQVFIGSSTPVEYNLKFETDGSSDAIEIIAPHPTKPDSRDVRELGVGLISLKIISI